MRWLRGGRIGLEFAHETKIECAPEQRHALLLDVMRRSFPDLVANQPESAPEPAPEPEEIDTSRRADIRHPLIWNGEILWQHDVHTVRLRNISEWGALIDAQIDFPAGVELMLDLGDSGQYFATVGWSRRGQAGLVFKNSFDLSVLAGIKPDVAPQKWNKPTYFDRSSGEGSPWASEWERSPLADLRSDLEGFLKR